LAPKDIASTNHALMLGRQELNPEGSIEYNPDSWDGIRGIFRDHLVSVPSFAVVERQNPVQTEKNIKGISIGKLGLLYLVEVKMMLERKCGDFDEYVGPIIAAALYPAHDDEQMSGMVKTDHFIAVSLPYRQENRTRFTRAS
jgi:hypothetical protein